MYDITSRISGLLSYRTPDRHCDAHMYDVIMYMFNILYLKALTQEEYQNPLLVELRSLIPHSMIWAQNSRLLYLVTMSRLKRGRCRLYVSDGVHSGLSLQTGCVNSLNLVKSVLGTVKISQVQANLTGYSRKQLGTVKPNRVQSNQCWTQIYVVTETHLATQQNIAAGEYSPLVHFITFRHKHKSF